MRWIIGAAVLVLAGVAYAQDPQATLDELMRRQLELNAQSHRNEAMRLELERMELEEQLRYRRMTTPQVSAELARYCPTGQPPCGTSPPPALLHEAARRGLIRFGSAPGAHSDCVSIRVDNDLSEIDCQ